MTIPPSTNPSKRHRFPAEIMEWVGTERGTLQVRFSIPPLPPYVTLSASYSDRLEVSFNLAASHRHPQEPSPAFASHDVAPRYPPRSGPSPVYTAFPCSMART
jgi:hypothetical protein